MPPDRRDNNMALGYADAAPDMTRFRAMPNASHLLFILEPIADCPLHYPAADSLGIDCTSSFAPHALPLQATLRSRIGIRSR